MFFSKNFFSGKQQTVTYRKITEENIRLINEDLKGYNWEEILETTGTDDTFNILHEALLTSMNKHMPLKTKKLTKKDISSEPWITKGIEKCIMNTETIIQEKYREKSNRSRPQEIRRIQKYVTKNQKKDKNGLLSRKM